MLCYPAGPDILGDLAGPDRHVLGDPAGSHKHVWGYLAGSDNQFLDGPAGSDNLCYLAGSEWLSRHRQQLVGLRSLLRQQFLCYLADPDKFFLGSPSRSGKRVWRDLAGSDWHVLGYRQASLG